MTRRILSARSFSTHAHAAASFALCAAAGCSATVCGTTRSGPAAAPRCSQSSTIGASAGGTLTENRNPAEDNAENSLVPTRRGYLLALGEGHTCLSSPDYGVFCWGDNRRGQVGTATGEPHITSPVQVRAQPASALAAGSEHTCADEYCWGRNSEGQLGDETQLDRALPTRISDALATRWSEAPNIQRPLGSWQWVLMSTGSWAVRRAELGYESFAAGSVPHVGMDCIEGTPCEEGLISASGFDSTLCAQLSFGAYEGYISCTQHKELLERRAYGDNESVRGPTLDYIEEIALGERFLCALRLDRRVECWGDLSGLRGDHGSARSTWISGNWNATKLVVGRSFGCFIRVDQRVFCFGSEPAMGLRGAGMQAGAAPASVATIDSGGERRSLRAVQTIGAGARHACAVGSLSFSSSSVFCWGKNDRGQLGNKSSRDSVTAVVTAFPLDGAP